MLRALSKKNMHIVFILFVVSVVFIMSSTSTAYAAEKKTYDEIFREYNLKTVSVVPEGVQPIEIKSEKELHQLLKTINNSVTKHAKKEKTPIVIDSFNRSDVSLMGTNTYTVDSYQIGVPLYGEITLKAAITDNGYLITNVIEYTTITGFHLGFDWNETAKGHDISSDGKDVYVWAEGEIEYYLLINGVIKLYTRAINLDGYLMIFH